MITVYTIDDQLATFPDIVDRVFEDRTCAGGFHYDVEAKGVFRLEVVELSLRVRLREAEIFIRDSKLASEL